MWQSGDRADVLHHCARFPWPAEPHVATFTVDRVVELGAGATRLEMTRCDGRALHVVVDGYGIDLDGHLVPHVPGSGVAP